VGGGSLALAHRKLHLKEERGGSKRMIVISLELIETDIRRRTLWSLRENQRE